MLIVSWNLAGRVKRQPEQAELVLGLGADVLCLQELTTSTLVPWRDRLRSAGYRSLASAAGEERARPLHVLTAAREPLEAVAVANVPWPERVLAVRLQGGPGSRERALADEQQAGAREAPHA